MKCFKLTCGMITSSTENAYWTHYSQSLITGWVHWKMGREREGRWSCSTKSLIFHHFLMGKVVWAVKTDWALLASAHIGWWGWTWCPEEHSRQTPFCSTSNTYSSRVAPSSANSTIFVSFKIQNFYFHITVHNIKLVFLILSFLHNAASN